MKFTFLHAADLHLGSPLTGLATKDETVARRFASASRDAFSDLVTHAITEKVAFLLISGDLYDGEWKDTSIGLFFNREMARLARAGIPTFLIRGNHDAESEVTKAVPLPASVIDFSTRKAETKRFDELKVAIHGRSFADRVVTENIALSYPAPVPGWLNIGMLHTSCEGHSAHVVYAPCSVSDLVNRGYDYWALGHVHDHAVLHEDPWIVYSGNLQGRSVRECGPKGAVLVDVADGRIAAVRPLVVDRARWLSLEVDLADTDREDQALAALREALREPLGASSGKMTALRVTLTGRTALHGPLKARASELADEVQALVDHVHEEAWLESLKIATSPVPVVAADSATANGVDPESVLAGLENDPAILARARELIAQVKAKLPGSLSEDALNDFDAILDDARAISIARALSATAR